MDKKVLTTPALYISYFLKKNRIEYYDRMTEVRRAGNYEQWVKFFLLALYEAATDAIETVDKLIALQTNGFFHRNIRKNQKTACIVFEYLEKNPIIEISKTSEALGMAYNTVSRIVKILRKTIYCCNPIKLGKHGFILMRSICKYFVKTHNNKIHGAIADSSDGFFAFRRR